MSDSNQEIVEQLKRINEQLESVRLSQSFLLQAFSLMNVGKTKGDVQAAWKEIGAVASEVQKKIMK